MAIALPLALIGLGFFIYLLFAAAAWALPVLVGFSAAMAADHAGAAGTTSILIGIAGFFVTIAVGRWLAILSRDRQPARIVVTLLFALPAAAATASVAAALGRTTGIGEWTVIASALAGAVVGGLAGRRTIDQPAP
jgi:hypothetical protein